MSEQNALDHLSGYDEEAAALIVKLLDKADDRQAVLEKVSEFYCTKTGEKPGECGCLYCDPEYNSRDGG